MVEEVSAKMGWREVQVCLVGDLGVGVLRVGVFGVVFWGAWKVGRRMRVRVRSV